MISTLSRSLSLSRLTASLRCTHLNPNTAIASALSIFALKPPFTHCSAPPLPARIIWKATRPARPAPRSPRPTVSADAMWEEWRVARVKEEWRVS